MPGLPCTPQPTRTRRSENGELRMKSSSLKCHDAERPGNNDHLWPTANLDEPSSRIEPVTKHLFLKPTLARERNDTSTLCSAPDESLRAAAAPTLLKLNGSVNRPSPSALHR